MLRFAATILMVCLVSTGCSGDDAYGSSSPPATAGSSALNGCSTFGAGDAIAWTMASNPPSTCLRVKKGGTVTWNGDLGAHPLAPKGGDAGNPITAVASGSSKVFTFDTPGTYGFVCTSHASMTGAISVVE